ncbi:MAG: hypothetical protein K6L74_01510 [Neptuniibacter sp.]
MIDVDVVTDVDEGYARDVHGVSGVLVDCFALGVIPKGSDDLYFPEPFRKNNLAISFTQSLADFIYEFAEKHYYCNEGDEILLLSAKVDCDQMDEASIISSFFARAEDAVSSGECIVIKRRDALAAESNELRQKVCQDIYAQNHIYLKNAAERIPFQEPESLKEAV